MILFNCNFTSLVATRCGTVCCVGNLVATFFFGINVLLNSEANSSPARVNFRNEVFSCKALRAGLFFISGELMVRYECQYCGKVKQISPKQKELGRGKHCGSPECRKKHAEESLPECVICGNKYYKSKNQKKYKHLCKDCIPIQREIYRLIKRKERECPLCGHVIKKNG